MVQPLTIDHISKDLIADRFWASAGAAIEPAPCAIFFSFVLSEGRFDGRRWVMEATVFACPRNGWDMKHGHRVCHSILDALNNTQSGGRQ
jgi:hypothetical protein